MVVFGGQRLEQLGYLARGLPVGPVLASTVLASTAEEKVHVAVGEIGREQVQVLEVGALDGPVQGFRAPDERLPAALDPGLDPEQETGRTLRV